MDDKDFAELVKIAVEKLKEDTVYEMVIHSDGYQEEKATRGLAEQRYRELHLTKKQRKVCDTFVDCMSGENLEYADYSYLAGLFDAFRIMAVLFPDRWNMEQVQRVLYSKVKAGGMKYD